MAVDYFEMSIDHIEKMNDGPFIGYISPRGHLLDYSMLFVNSIVKNIIIGSFNDRSDMYGKKRDWKISSYIF